MFSIHNIEIFSHCWFLQQRVFCENLVWSVCLHTGYSQWQWMSIYIVEGTHMYELYKCVRYLTEREHKCVVICSRMKIGDSLLCAYTYERHAI